MAVPPTFPRAGVGARIGAAVIACACFAVLFTASRLTPNPLGVETHRQLGLPACGWMLTTGMPCPTCGMTTAFAHATHLHFWEGIKTQPAGFLIALVTAMVFWAALHCVVFGSRWGWLADRMISRRVIVPSALFVFVAWGYKAWIVCH